MRMPTLLPFGEGRVSGEAINMAPNCPVVGFTVKPVGEPDAGDRLVRFDERGWETERCRMAQATAPILDSTVATFRCGANVWTLLDVKRTLRVRSWLVDV
jgi:hypothetical protein